MVVPLYRPFTRAEQRVAGLLLEGKGPSAIATLLGVSRNTVKFHIRMLEMKVPGTLPIRLRLVRWDSEH